MKKLIIRIFCRIKEGLLQEIWSATTWIYQYVRRYWKYILFYAGIGLFQTFFSLGSGLISKDLVDIITKHQTGEVVRTFSYFIGFSLGNILLSQVLNYVSSWISITVDNEIKSDIFSKILITDWESITAYHTGDLLTRWSSDVSVVSNGILNWIPNLFIYTVRFISSLAIILFYDPTFALLSLIGMPVSLIMSKTLLARMQSNNKQSAALYAKMSGFNQETFSNIQTIKAFDLVRLYSNRLKQLQKEYLVMKMSFQKMSMKTSIMLSAVGLFVSYTCYAWGIYRVWNGSITYGTMTLFLSLSGTMTSTLSSLISLVPTAISISTSVGRLKDILDMPREDYREETMVAAFKASSKKTGVSLEIEGMDYTYHTGTEVFRELSFSAHPHEIVAVVGPSGEGKTTFLRVLLSLLIPQQGSCYLTNEAGERLALTPAARRLFSYVPQGNTMFYGTIAENMRNVNPDVTEEEIMEALKAACAYEFVLKLPDGIHTLVKERGGGFSEGQAQRLSIARALLRKAPILLLDEATSALDVATERTLLHNIMQDEYPRTCIVTTHRPTVLSMCQKVYQIADKQCILLSEEEVETRIRDF